MGEVTNIKKQTEEVTKKEKQFGKYREELRSKCLHTRNGEMTLVSRNQKGANGENVFICKQCQKEIRINTIDDAAIDSACSTLDQMIDIIKITANEHREEDVEMASKLAKVQYRIRNEIVPLYRAALKNSSHRNGKRRDQETPMWSKPTTGY